MIYGVSHQFLWQSHTCHLTLEHNVLVSVLQQRDLLAHRSPNLLQLPLQLINLRRLLLDDHVLLLVQLLELMS